MQQQIQASKGALQNALVGAASRGAITSEEAVPGYTRGIPTEAGTVRSPTLEALAKSKKPGGGAGSELTTKLRKEFVVLVTKNTNFVNV